MTTLYLCEKPSQAKDIARVLGATQRRDGYFEGQQTIVTWCFGHLLEMAAPEDYDPELKSWRFETLPIIPGKWVWKVRKDAKKQYNIIVGLFKQADELVISTDADREGESIAREVMERGGWNGPVSRLWLSALDDQSIRKALANRLPGQRTEPLYAAAAARSKADWLVGMSLSRLYTLSARQSGYEGGVMSVGRVQTPTLKLVVDRDRVIEHFKPVPYYDVTAIFSNGECFSGKWQVPEDMADDEGRCLNRSTALAVAERCRGKTAVVRNVATKRIKESAPLPYSLSALQQDASNRFGMGAQVVLDTAQALYETHKLTTYPRTDCDYLPQTQFESAAAIIDVLKADDEFRSIAGHADFAIRSKAWNDKKITAHHAIIPTGVKRSGSLNANESRLYELIVRRYLSQFYPDYEYDRTVVDIAIGDDRFKSIGKQVVVTGWRLVVQDGREKGEKDEPVLPKLAQDDPLAVSECRVDDKETKPPARYTEGTLIQAMKNVGKWVENPALKKRLKDTSGIGTEATRASIIELLLKRGFIVKQKKHLVSSEKARSLIDVLPEPVKDPATTAVWEQALEDIAQGNGDPDRFVEDQANMVSRLVERVKQQQGMQAQFKTLAENTQQYSCPKCEHPLVRRKGKNGFFWGCRNYPDCQVVLPDDKGKPGKPRVKAESTGQRCSECGEGELVKRVVRNGKNIGETFLGCSRYPECRYTEG